jgi:hypothetical protein
MASAPETLAFACPGYSRFGHDPFTTIGTSCPKIPLVRAVQPRISSISSSSINAALLVPSLPLHGLRSLVDDMLIAKSRGYL